MERRADARIAIRLPCQLEVSAATTLLGHTVDMCSAGVLIDSHDLTRPGIQKPRINQSGLLTVVCKHVSRNPLKLPCRIAHVTAGCIGLNLHLASMDRRQQQIFRRLLGIEDDDQAM